MTKKVSEVTVLRIDELPQALERPLSALGVIFDPETNATFSIDVNLLAGGEKSTLFWSPTETYETGDIREFGLRLWKSLQDNNTNRTPIEGAWWTEVSRSEGNGFGYWGEGVYDIDPSVVIQNDKIYYLNTTAVSLPFESTDFAAEEALNIWKLLGGEIVAATNADMDAGTENGKFVPPLKFVYGITTRVFSGLATVNKTIQGAINWLQNLTILLKEPTGFRYPDQVIVTYDGAARTITLTGNTEAYYRGNQVAALVSGWVSDAHDVADGTYFLYFDGTNFVWSNTPWSFDVVMIAMAYRDGVNFCLRECHGLMQWQTHQEFHETLGTYLHSGGDIGAIVLNSTTAADRRPTLTAALIKDEDLPTSLPSLSAGAYSQLYLSGSNTANLIADQADILPLSTNQPFYNQFTGGAWQQTLFPVNAYGKVFIMAVPVTADTECQKRRFVFIQPQQVSTTLSEIQNITIASVNIGHIAGALAEYVFIGEIIVRFTAGNWVVTSTAKLTGTRVLQGQIFGGGGGGGTVLSGNVTLSTPLLGATNQDEYNVANLKQIRRVITFNNAASIICSDYYPNPSSITTATLTRIATLEVSTDNITFTPVALPLSVSGAVWWRITFAANESTAVLTLKGTEE